MDDRDEFIDESEAIHQAVAIHDMIVYCNLAEIPVPDPQYQLKFRKSNELTPRERSQMMNIFTLNMEELYLNSGWGWDIAAKQKEIFHITSRFLYLTIPNPNGKEDQVVGYVMFRFEWDDEEEPEHPVIFVYELQVSSSFQHKGIGKYLMQLLNGVSTTCRMWKIMLTCFKENTTALKFYYSIGYNIDVNSPSRCGYEEETYEILSNKPDLK